MKWILPTIVIIALVFCGACTQSQTNTPPTTQTTQITVVKTVVPTRAIPTTVVTTEPIPQPTEEEVYEAIEPDWTEAPIVLPTVEPDTTKINFTRFQNNYVRAIYPSTWSVENDSFIVDDTTINGQDVFLSEGKGVSFYSEDRNVSMRILAKDWIVPGKHIYKPTIDTVRNIIGKKYPNTSVDTSVYNYQFRKNDQNIFTASYDIIFSTSSQYYPYSYSEEVWVTYHSLWTVIFITKNGNLEEYRELKYQMMKSVVTEGSQDRPWW